MVHVEYQVFWINPCKNIFNLHPSLFLSFLFVEEILYIAWISLENNTTFK